MNNIKQLYFGIGICNSLLIFPGNLYNGSKDQITEFKRYWEGSRFERMILPAPFGLISFGMLLMVLSKTTCYALAGPLGTYRILLAHHNRRVTSDVSWTNAIYKPCFSIDFDSEPYILYPVGQASWLPLR